jgi:hypothetical protein
MPVPDAVSERSLPPVVAAFVGVVVDLDTYRGLLYLALSFPLGISYFVVLVTLGALVAEFWPVGVVLAPLLVVAVHGLAWFERALVVYVLGREVPTEEEPLQWLREAVRDPPGAREFARLGGRLLVAPRTWTRSLLVAAKFPVGIAAFVALVVAGTMTGLRLGAPFLYDVPGTRLQVLRPAVSVVVPAVERAGVSVGGTPALAVTGTLQEVETLPGALATSVVGAVVGVASLHLLYWTALAYGWLTSLLFGVQRPSWGPLRRT